MGELPTDWESFYKDMCTRARTYTKINYWEISEDDLNLWLSNFQTDEEKFLSSLIIYRLIYRNKQSRLSMYHHIIEILLPDILRNAGIYDIQSLDQFHNDLQSNRNIPFRFSTIEEVDEQTSKSGHAILRDFARDGSFHNNLKVTIATLSSLDRERVKAIILFDDFMGTGEQFKTYMDNFTNQLEGFTIIYCPLAAHIDGINCITEKNYSNVIVCPVEIVDEKYSFFNNKFMPRIVENINMHALQIFYEDLMHSKTRLTQQLLGRGNQSLLYIFDESSPNNSLPVLVYNDINWHKLFSR